MIASYVGVIGRCEWSMWVVGGLTSFVCSVFPSLRREGALFECAQNRARAPNPLATGVMGTSRCRASRRADTARWI